MIDLIRPFELQRNTKSWDGRYSSDDVWDMLLAARNGVVEQIDKLIEKDASLVNCQYWYTPPIHLAVREGHLEVVRKLVEAGSDTSHRSLDGSESLLDFAQDRGHDDVASYLSNLNPTLAAKDLPIHQAVKNRNHELVLSLLSDASEISNSIGALGRTPLHYAVECEDPKMVELLIQHGANVDTVGFSSDDRLGGDGFRPVALALWHHPYWRQRNNYDIVRTLIRAGALYSLTIAAALGDIERVRRLMDEEHIDPNEQESGGKRPLSAASERDHSDVVKILLDRGADPNLAEGPNCPGGFALWAAARGGFMQTAELLLEHGANPNAQVESSGSATESAKNAEMRNLLYRYGGRVGLPAHYHQQNIDVIAALLDRCPEKFSELDITDGFTAAVSNDDEDLVRLLLSKGMRVPAIVTSCQSYLWQSLPLAELLLQHGMDPNLPNWQSMSPLHHMAAKGQVDEARLFIRYGADLNAVDEEYRSTPLGWAARKGQTEFVRFLIDYDATLCESTPDEQAEWATPLKWAERRGHQEIVQLLQTVA